MNEKWSAQKMIQKQFNGYARKISIKKSSWYYRNWIKHDIENVVLSFPSNSIEARVTTLFVIIQLKIIPHSITYISEKNVWSRLSLKFKPSHSSTRKIYNVVELNWLFSSIFNKTRFQFSYNIHWTNGKPKFFF